MIEITVLNKDNVPTGPFTRRQVAEKLRTGEFTLSQLAFIPGLSQWIQLRDVLIKVDGGPYAASVPSVARAPSPSFQPLQPAQAYAGFWLRFVAYLVDDIILEIPLLTIAFIIGLVYGLEIKSHNPEASVGFLNRDGTWNTSFVILELGIVSFSLTVRWLYFALQESSSAQATLGKRLLGLRVTDLNGNRIGFGCASSRFFGKIISTLILGIGFIMAGFTDKKQALHDMMAETLVMRN